MPAFPRSCFSALLRPPWRTLAAGSLVLAAFLLWRFPVFAPGLEITDGRHDRGHNGIWLQHGWLGDDDWFRRTGKEARVGEFRDVAAIRALTDRLRAHGFTDLFPHVCPANPDGTLPGVDHAQVERFLDACAGMRVLPWIGGSRRKSAFPERAEWRDGFARSAAALLAAHPRLAGVHLNIEPCLSGSQDFLLVLEAVRRALPPGALLSVAAYPPPTVLHPFLEVHWDEAYTRAVAARADQLAVMMYDTALKQPYAYQRLMAEWTQEVLAWSDPAEVLLGVPAYDDAGVGYHHPDVENLEHALMGVHRGLAEVAPVPVRYRGIAVYCEWEMDDAEWEFLRRAFLRPTGR